MEWDNDPKLTAGVPAEIVSLFLNNSQSLARFSIHTQSEVDPFVKLGHETWAHQFYCRASGHRLCYQVYTDPTRARTGRFVVTLLMHRQEIYGPEASDDYLDLELGCETPAGRDLERTLDLFGRYGTKLARGLPWRPGQPATV